MLLCDEVSEPCAILDDLDYVDIRKFLSPFSLTCVTETPKANDSIASSACLPEMMRKKKLLARVKTLRGLVPLHTFMTQRVPFGLISRKTSSRLPSSIISSNVIKLSVVCKA